MSSVSSQDKYAKVISFSKYLGNEHVGTEIKNATPDTIPQNVNYLDVNLRKHVQDSC
jgi:hypothetical protein